MCRFFRVATLLLVALLSACSTVRTSEELMLGPELDRDEWDTPSQVYQDLVNMPKPRGKIVASVYSFRDLTGQYKPAPSSTFSTAVSQGAAAMLVKAVRDSGWFAPLEREGLQDLLTERKIIRAALKNKNANQDLPPLLGANIVLEGGIIAYETNMKTGGAGAKYFGIGASEQYRVDQVSVNLRVVDVNTGRVINSVTTSKSILSKSLQGGIFRFVRFKRLLEMEAGYTRNEPVQLCLLEAIQAAVLRIIVEGVEDNSWSLASATDINHPLLFKYGTRLKPPPPPKPKKEKETKSEKVKKKGKVKGALASKGISLAQNKQTSEEASQPAEESESEEETNPLSSPSPTAPTTNAPEMDSPPEQTEPPPAPTPPTEIASTPNVLAPTEKPSAAPQPSEESNQVPETIAEPIAAPEKPTSPPPLATATPSPPPIKVESQPKQQAPATAPIASAAQKPPASKPAENKAKFVDTETPNIDPVKMIDNELSAGEDQNDTLESPEESFGNEFTIQLISSSSSTEVLKFAEKNNLSRSMIEYIHYEIEGQDRFAILYGRYASKKNAQRALEDLPARVKVFDPWVRTYQKF